MATKAPEKVSCADDDADGVEAFWSVPVGDAPESAPMHTHMGGSVLMSMHSDRKAASRVEAVDRAIAGMGRWLRSTLRLETAVA